MALRTGVRHLDLTDEGRSGPGGGADAEARYRWSTGSRSQSSKRVSNSMAPGTIVTMMGVPGKPTGLARQTSP